MKAYVTGDWERKEDVSDAIRVLEDSDAIENTSTWITSAKGVLAGVANKRHDVIRNCDEIDRADCVVAVLFDKENKHWGSLANIAYAVGQGKPCYVILMSEGNYVFSTSHFVYHPLVRFYRSMSAFIDEMVVTRVP